MGVPNPHDKPPLRLPKPIPDHGDNAGPADRLEETADDLDCKEEAEAVDAPPIAHPKGCGRDTASEHAKGEEAAEVDPVADVASEVHAGGIGREEGEVELTQAMGAARAVKGRPAGIGGGGGVGGGDLGTEDGFDDGRGLAGGVEGGVGGEREEEDGDLVEEEATPPRRWGQGFHGRNPRSGGGSSGMEGRRK